MRNPSMKCAVPNCHADADYSVFKQWFGDFAVEGLDKQADNLCPRICHQHMEENEVHLTNGQPSSTGGLRPFTSQQNLIYNIVYSPLKSKYSSLFEDSHQTKPPEQVVELVQALSIEIIRYLSSHPRELYNLRPRQFEALVAEVLASYGWEVELTPATSDGGYDIYAIAPTGVPSVTSHWIIECKKYASEHSVGVELVRALYGVKTDLRIGNAMLATTSQRFTRGAAAFKASKYDLELRSYCDILEWINNYRSNPNGRLHIEDNRIIVPRRDV